MLWRTNLALRRRALSSCPAGAPALARYADAARPSSLAGAAASRAVVPPLGNGRVDVAACARAIQDFGFVVLPGLYADALLESLSHEFIGRTDRVLRDLAAWHQQQPPPQVRTREKRVL